MLLGVARVEQLADVCDEIVRDSDARKLDELGELAINWRLYKELEAAKMTLLVTAQEMNTVAGFSLYTIFYHPHHNERIGQCAMLNVRVRYRGRHVGRTLVEFAMNELKRLGCGFVVHGYRPVYDVPPLFPKLGFTEFDRFYIKELN